MEVVREISSREVMRLIKDRQLMPIRSSLWAAIAPTSLVAFKVSPSIIGLTQFFIFK